MKRGERRSAATGLRHFHSRYPRFGKEAFDRGVLALAVEAGLVDQLVRLAAAQEAALAEGMRGRSAAASRPHRAQPVDVGDGVVAGDAVEPVRCCVGQKLETVTHGLHTPPESG